MTTQRNSDQNSDTNTSTDSPFLGTDEAPVKRREIRLRRLGSTSKVETIVTEDEKLRRAQPDKPIHKPRDSILSWGSEFSNYEGLVNWGFLLLILGGLRLTLENFNKYGIRVNPSAWLLALFGNLDPSSNHEEYPTMFLIMYINVPLILALVLELLVATQWMSWKFAKILHFINLGSCLMVPVIVINSKFDHVGPVHASQTSPEPKPVINSKFDDVGPAMSTIACALYAILFLKVWSYVQVNHWCRTASLNRPKILAKAARHPSLADFPMPSVGAAARPFPRKARTSSMRDSLGNASSIVVQYPDNLSLKDIYYFWFAPTLCYELNFPRSGRIRKMFLLRRALEVLVGTNIALALAQQWIIPSVVNSLIPFTNMDPTRALERILKLAIPNHLLWLTWAYLIFHSFLNSLAEMMGFADRNFYNDWWNACDVMEFWKTWNLPVHRWCVRHLYKPLLNLGYTKFTAAFVVFLFSAIFHEYLISVPLRMFKIYAFLGMIAQMPLMIISQKASKHFGNRAGNLLMWQSLIIGHPLAIMMYYHDFVVAHYGEDVLVTFGTMSKN